MDFKKFEIEGLVLFKPKKYEDDRGFFMESYRQSLFAKNGIVENFIQDNHVSSFRGVLRGLHYQTEPMAQAKLVRVIRGSIYDVVVDIRKHSPTFGKWLGVTLDAKENGIFYVPKGFAHGYCALEDDSEVLYKVSADYSPKHEQGILWSDPEVGVEWPRLGCDYIISAKDKVYPSLKDAAVFV